MLLKKLFIRIWVALALTGFIPGLQLNIDIEKMRPGIYYPGVCLSGNRSGSFAGE